MSNTNTSFLALKGSPESSIKSEQSEEKTIEPFRTTIFYKTLITFTSRICQSNNLGLYLCRSPCHSPNNQKARLKMGWGSKKTEKDLSLRICPGTGDCNGCELLRQIESRTPDGVTSLRSLYGQIPSPGELNPPPGQHRICARLVGHEDQLVPVAFAAAQKVPNNPGTAEVMYYVQSTEQGQGVGTVIATAIINLLRSFGFRKAHLDISPADTASIHVAQKLGAEKVGPIVYSGADLQGWDVKLQ